MIISMLTDYGHDDEFAGVCRAVIARIAPEARVIDLTHGIGRHDVRQGAAVLANSLPFTPTGIHLAIVDPAVGSERKAIAVRVTDSDRLLVGPDNGLLSLAWEKCGGAVEAVDISRSPLRLEPVSATFHGRDIFAPVAARLALGDRLADLGETLDPELLTRLERSEAVVERDRRVVAEVAYVDRFGNAALDLGEEDLLEAGLKLGRRLWVEGSQITLDAVYALAFADVGAGELILYLDSYRHPALAVNRGSAAEQLGIGAGDRVVLRPAT